MQRFIIKNPRTVKVMVEVVMTYDANTYDEESACFELEGVLEAAATEQNHEYLHIKDATWKAWKWANDNEEEK